MRHIRPGHLHQWAWGTLAAQRREQQSPFMPEAEAASVWGSGGSPHVGRGLPLASSLGAGGECHRAQCGWEDRDAGPQNHRGPPAPDHEGLLPAGMIACASDMQSW